MTFFRYDKFGLQMCQEIKNLFDYEGTFTINCEVIKTHSFEFFSFLAHKTSLAVYIVPSREAQINPTRPNPAGPHPEFNMKNSI